MKTTICSALLLLLFFCMITPSYTTHHEPPEPKKPKYRDPDRFNKAIQTYKDRDNERSQNAKTQNRHSQV